MTSTHLPASSAAGMDPGLCQATYLAGLAQANALQAQSVAPKTLKIRHQHARELADWLQSTKIGRTLQTCLPEDVLVFFTTAWLPAHAGSATATGQKIAAPSSLSSIRSSLSTEFEQLGRSGEWNPATLQGNPMLSNQLRRMTKGYKVQASQRGYQVRAAEPISSDKVKALLTILMQQHATDVDRLLLIGMA